MKKYLLELTVFISGALVMIYELVGARMLGPYFGTSIFIWTSLIGIILGSLSLGYYLGGRLADKKPNLKVLIFILVFSAVSILFTYFIKDSLLIFLSYKSQHILDIRFSSTVASIILFAPASILLGMVSPYTVKLKLDNLSSSGKTVGNLYAISTLGSIFGTFLAGFYLIPFFGTNQLLLALPGALVLLAIIISIVDKQLKIVNNLRIFFFLIIFFSVLSFGQKNSAIVDVDTSYNRIWIYDRHDHNSDRKIRIMGINNENHSSMFLDSDELANEYSKYYRLVEFLKPDFQSALMFGGAGYSFPKYYLQNYINQNIDVVEIDPKVTKLAKKYFKLSDNPRLKIYHQDARVFLNNNKNKYDVIFGDAFGSHYSVPYQLSTIEAIEKKYQSLVEDGLVILNMASALEGPNAWFAHSQYLSYRQIFNQVFIFQTINDYDPNLIQNVILVALKQEQKINWSKVNEDLRAYVDNLYELDTADLQGIVLTDNYAPVDYYMAKIPR